MTLRLTGHFIIERCEVIPSFFSPGFRPSPTLKGRGRVENGFLPAIYGWSP
jgi:hypothetical protein